MKVVQTSGTRKTSIARVSLQKGTGDIRINSRPLHLYTPEYLKQRIEEALIIADKYSDKIDIVIKVHGGGNSSQADAIRVAIGKAIIEFTKDEKLKRAYLDYDRKLLVDDVRRKEPCKPNISRARAKRQKSYR